MSRKWALRAGIVGAAMMATGCGGGGPEVTVIMSDTGFEPNRFTIYQREKSVLVLQNTGAVEHNLLIRELNLSSGIIAPGKTGRLDIVPLKGPLKFVCTIPGHEEAGMIGEIVVEPKKR